MRRTLAILGLAVVTLVIAEALVRGWAHHLRDEIEQFDPAIGAFALAPGRYDTGTSEIVINSDGFPGLELATRGPDLFRIATLGDSCTYGEGSATLSYPAMLQTLLEERAEPPERIEVVNAGVAGATSGDALARLVARVLPLQPDVVTVYIGWNDLSKYSPIAQAGDRGVAGLARSVDELWLVRGLRKLAFFHLREALTAPDLGAGSRTGRFASFSPAVFEHNLREIVVGVRAAGSAPVLLTLPTPLRLETDTAWILERPMGFPYFLGGARLGDYLDLIGAYNRSIWRVALDNGVPVADLAKGFSELEDATEFFFDPMHTNPAGRALTARFIAETLEESGLLPVSPDLGEDSAHRSR